MQNKKQLGVCHFSSARSGAPQFFWSALDEQRRYNRDFDGSEPPAIYSTAARCPRAGTSFIDSDYRDRTLLPNTKGQTTFGALNFLVRNSSKRGTSKHMNDQQRTAVLTGNTIFTERAIHKNSLLIV